VTDRRYSFQPRLLAILGRAVSPFTAGIRRGAEFAPYRAVALLIALVYVSASLLHAETSEPAPLAAKSLLLDVARAGDRLVAVGDRGHILLSDDEGVTWRQVAVPTRAMLTGVSFGDAAHGWAVGHDGVILATADSGATWTRQDPGNDLETVWLDVFFSDPLHGLAVGAYAKCLLTMDGGKTWQPAGTVPDEVHLNQIAPTATDTVYLSGEAGTLLVSDDARKPWRKLNVPYDGSLFGLLPLGDRTLLVYGLRGHVFLSDDAGQTWAPREISVPVLLMAGVRMKSGVIVLAGLGGNFHVSRDAGATFALWQPETYNGGVSALLEARDGALIVVGEKGAARLQLPLK
ncbi:MAG TPA: YCF48-related protein, partial [Lacunisphaera sp.]